MEKLIETVEVQTTDGRQATFEIVEDADRYEGQRAYAKGKTLFYEMPVFEAGLLKAKSVTRTPA